MSVKSFLKDLITESDNTTGDIVRVLMLLFGVATIIAIILAIVLNRKEILDYINEWMLMIFGGGGAALAAKGKFEPPSERSASFQQVSYDPEDDIPFARAMTDEDVGQSAP